MVGADDGWAVGEAGTIIRWDGTDWSTWTSPTTATLYDVFMVSSIEGWAVGSSGRILRWNGTDWNTVTCPTTEKLKSVFMVGADDGWAVGEGGTTVHWDGSSWKNVPSPTVLDLWSVFMVGADDGWAVGESIIHWNGTDWNMLTKPTLNRFHSVFMVGADYGWMVGERILRWNGSSWIAGPATPWYWSVFMVGADDGWAVGDEGRILRWNGTDWSTWTSPTTATLYDVFMISSIEGWAVGSSGRIIRWNGTDWIPEHTLMPVVSVDPPVISASLRENFTVEVKITNVKNLYTYQFKLSWDPNLLNVTSVTEGSFLNAQGIYNTVFFKKIWNEPDPLGDIGYTYVACSLLGEPTTAAVSGSGTLAKLEFLVKEEENTSLHLYDTMLVSPFSVEITHLTEDGIYGTEDTKSPLISILFPENKTYSVTDVSLTFIVSESTSWIGYSLDGKANVTITENTTLTGLSDGIHRLTVYAKDIAGNMGYSETKHFTIDTVPPNIEFLSPENKTYTVTDVSFSFTISEATPWISYSLDREANVTIAGNMTLVRLSGGVHSLVVYAKDIAGNIGSSETVCFTVDATAPNIFVLSLENKTYYATEVALNFTVDDSVSWVAYSLDGKANVTITENTTLTGLSDGIHRLTVYAKDIAGNTGASKTIHFSIKIPTPEPQPSEPFPTWIVAAIAIVALSGAAVLVYFRKIKQTTEEAKE